MTFNVDSYLEYFLTLLGWIINNGLFGLLVSTGAFYCTVNWGAD